MEERQKRARGESTRLLLRWKPGRIAKTMLRWQKEPEFTIAFLAAKRAAFGHAIGRLHQLSSAAVSTLGKVMLEPGTPPATRVRAADSILDHTIKAIAIEGLESRLTELERAAEANEGR